MLNRDNPYFVSRRLVHERIGEAPEVRTPSAGGCGCADEGELTKDLHRSLYVVDESSAESASSAS
jgi:hypothetical protein